MLSSALSPVFPSIPLLPAGSLTVSITDMRAPLVGGSGGVYALCSAHLANVVMVGPLAVQPTREGTGVGLVCGICPPVAYWDPRSS